MTEPEVRTVQVELDGHVLDLVVTYEYEPGHHGYMYEPPQPDILELKHAVFLKISAEMAMKIEKEIFGQMAREESQNDYPI